VESGAELRERFLVQDLVIEDGRVTGVRGRAADGTIMTERARIVIGADGRNSMVARATRAAAYNEAPVQTCVYYSYWSGVPLSGMELYPRDGRFIGAFPTHGDQVCIYVMWRHGEFTRFRSDIQRGFMESVALAPEFAERVRAGRREERWMGTGGAPGYFRVPYGPGWALVGDAGYAKDPITGFGITDSFRDAELLAGALDAGFSGQQPLDEALAAYQQARDAVALPLYQGTCEAAELNGVSPQLVQFFAALRLDPEQVSRFFGVLAGTVRRDEFFSRDNIAGIFARAQAAIQEAA
jgi:flavin-dependent dehydrogenase